jgi:hypothetical protein
MLQPRAQAEHARIERQLGKHASTPNLRLPAAGYRVNIAQLRAQADVGRKNRSGVICKGWRATAFVDGTKRLTSQ